VIGPVSDPSNGLVKENAKTSGNFHGMELVSDFDCGCGCGCGYGYVVSWLDHLGSEQ